MIVKNGILSYCHIVIVETDIHWLPIKNYEIKKMSTLVKLNYFH